ncbi:MAG: single-stranded-DNA-specific exonuclease RecJ [Oscillospiraceae bacterium]|jgi:single-stranded-DNA-specific exonuclease|nr:single-stranded-DNA-specific exonuclease RecJ [Oscillospiraceae bacterium]
MLFEQWEIHGFDRSAAVKLVRAGVNALPAVFLCSRGITTEDDAKHFMTHTEADILDPFLMLDMDRAVARITRAIETRETVAVFGDYDVDGMTASALIKSYLATRGVDAEIYIPGRSEEGYGLNRTALDYLHSRGVNLVITVDCGITAADEVEYGKSLGMEFVITDHHECKCRMPDACAVVDPKRPESEYPNRVLAGVGVAFKLVCAMEPHRPLSEMLDLYGDFVAIGTVADVMPVMGENRALIREGLRRLEKSPREGLSALMRAANVPNAAINTAVIGFMLAPRLNAAGRMGRTSLSIDILLTKDPVEAENLTRELVRLNDQRRELESAIFEEVKLRAVDEPQGVPIVMSGENWYHGVMGIVAARTAERFMLPAVMINVDEDGIGRGSCRSVGDFKMYTALSKCSDLLINFGGHEMAVGITIPRENIDELRTRLAVLYREQVSERQKPCLHIDFEVEKPQLLVLENIESLALLEPFGNGNLPPCLTISGATVLNLIPVGGGKHSRVKIEKDRVTLDCIFFSSPPENLGIADGDLVDVAFEPQLNEFRGRRSVQLHVLDIRKTIYS